MNNRDTNIILDTGAGASVIDLGTVEHLNLQSRVKSSDCNTTNCYDASGNQMNIIGTIHLNISLVGCKMDIWHEFLVLNIRSNRALLMGHDALTKFKTVTFNFENKQVKVGNSWLKIVANTEKQTTRLCNDVIHQPRSERVVQLRSKKGSAFTLREFVPKKVPGCNGVFFSKAQIIPDADGQFMVTVLNVNEQEMRLKKKQLVGYIEEPSEIIAEVDRGDADIQTELNKVQYGTKLDESQKKDLNDLIHEYRDIFASNPKKLEFTLF